MTWTAVQCSAFDLNRSTVFDTYDFNPVILLQTTSLTTTLDYAKNLAAAIYLFTSLFMVCLTILSTAQILVLNDNAISKQRAGKHVKKSVADQLHLYLATSTTLTNSKIAFISPLL